jgi:hypothetical protein
LEKGCHFAVRRVFREKMMVAPLTGNYFHENTKPAMAEVNLSVAG